MMTDKGEITLVPEKCNKTYTRFKTPYMSEIMPDAPEPTSGWSTNNYYFYEIKNLDGGKEFFVQLAVSSKDIPSELRSVCDRINRHFPSKQQKENWQWRTHFSTRTVKVEEELSEEKVFEQLNRRFDELKSFESKLKTALAAET